MSARRAVPMVEGTRPRHLTLLTRVDPSALARGWAVGACSTLPGTHAIGHAFMEVRRAHGGLDAAALHSLPHFVAHMGECQADALALQLPDGAQHRVAGGGVDEVHRACVQEYLLRRRAARAQR